MGVIEDVRGYGEKFEKISAEEFRAMMNAAASSRRSDSVVRGRRPKAQ